MNLAKGIQKWLNREYPQNYILKKPFIGSLVFAVFCFGFVILYRPLSIHESRFLNFGFTMAAYCLAATLPLIGLIGILKKTRYFSSKSEWTILKEILSIFIILLEFGIVIYFAAFILEPPAQRWNLPTFLDSVKNAFLVGIVPFAFSSLLNYRYLFDAQIVQYTGNEVNPPAEPPEKLIHIESQLKKEELSFYPGQLIYAESEGNYVVFYLEQYPRIRREIIRNSISQIEQQLSGIPYFMRTHRAFIVNVKKVSSKKGNTLGYRIKLSDIQAEIPVSRQNTRNFNQLLKQLR